MIDSNIIPYGTGVKYALSLAASGFSMMDDSWRVELTGSAGTVVLDKSDCICDEQNHWFFVFDTTAVGPGLVRIKVVAEVVDYDFSEGSREEVWEDNLCRVGRPMGCGMS